MASPRGDDAQLRLLSTAGSSWSSTTTARARRPAASSTRSSSARTLRTCDRPTRRLERIQGYERAVRDRRELPARTLTIPRRVDGSTPSTTRSPTTGLSDSTDGSPVPLTGAAGFVGSRVARALLERGYAVHAVVRDSAAPRLQGVSGLRLEVCELTDDRAVSELVARAEPELCVHCAWIATPGEYSTSPLNSAHEAAAETLARALVAARCREARRARHVLRVWAQRHAACRVEPARPDDDLRPRQARGVGAARARLRRHGDEPGLGAAVLPLRAVRGPDGGSSRR